MKQKIHPRLFHAGRGKWEVRYKKRGKPNKIYGIGYFYSKKEAEKLLNKLKKTLK